MFYYEKKLSTFIKYYISFYKYQKQSNKSYLMQKNIFINDIHRKIYHFLSADVYGSETSVKSGDLKS